MLQLVDLLLLAPATLLLVALPAVQGGVRARIKLSQKNSMRFLPPLPLRRLILLLLAAFAYMVVVALRAKCHGIVEFNGRRGRL